MNRGTPWWVRWLPLRYRDFLASREGAQRAIENAAWLMGDRVIRLFLVFAVNVAIARHLGPEQFGLLSYVLAFTALFAAFSTAGVDSILVRELVREREPERLGALVGTAITLRLTCALLGYFAVSVTGALLHGVHALATALIALAGSVLLFQALDVGDPWFQAKTAARYAVLARGGALALGAATKIVFIVAELPTPYFVAAQVFETVLGTVFLMAVYRSSAGAEYKWSFDRPLARSLVRECSPLFVSALAVAAYMRLDVILIAVLASQDDVGYYSAAQRLVELWYFVPTAVCMSVLPSLVRSRSSNPELFFRRLSLLYRFTALSSGAFALAMAMFSNRIIAWLYGSEYASAADVLKILACAGIAAALGIASSQYVIVERLGRVALVRTLMGLGTAVVLLVVLVPTFKSVGAAVATAAGYSVATFAILFFPGLGRHRRCMLGALNPLPLLVSVARRKRSADA